MEEAASFKEGSELNKKGGRGRKQRGMKGEVGQGEKTRKEEL